MYEHVYIDVKASTEVGQVSVASTGNILHKFGKLQLWGNILYKMTSSDIINDNLILKQPTMMAKAYTYIRT